MNEQERQAHILHTYGIYNARDAVAAAHFVDIPMSVAAADLQMESSGRNVFGHDPVRTGQVVGGNVTRARYDFYKARRRLGLGNQGVGPCQLTSPGLQDDADRLGGCWKPYYNMVVGFRFLKALHDQYGDWQLAFQHYNGSGPAAVHYGQTAEAIMGLWHRRFTA